MNLIPLPYRLLAIATLIASCVGFGWVKGAGHVQDAWDAATVRQSLIVAHIQAKQTQATKDIDHATRSLVSRSDDYWRLRVKPVQADPVSGTSGESHATAETDQADPEGRTGGCSPADGAADALVILGWQEWVRAMQEAQR
jgi:hypothetical protein